MIEPPYGHLFSWLILVQIVGIDRILINPICAPTSLMNWGKTTNYHSYRAEGSNLWNLESHSTHKYRPNCTSTISYHQPAINPMKSQFIVLQYVSISYDFAIQSHEKSGETTIFRWLFGLKPGFHAFCPNPSPPHPNPFIPSPWNLLFSHVPMKN